MFHVSIGRQTTKPNPELINRNARLHKQTTKTKLSTRINKVSLRGLGNAQRTVGQMGTDALDFGCFILTETQLRHFYPGVRNKEKALAASNRTALKKIFGEVLGISRDRRNRLTHFTSLSRE